MIERIDQGAMFINECPLEGETRAEGAWPAMADAMPLSAKRWIVLYSTRGFLGVDEGFSGSDNDRSIAWQLRDGGPTGPVIRHGLFARYSDDWDPLGDGTRNLRQHCHAGVFGVPKGALVNGRRVPHENVFVASWYCSPRAKGTDANSLPTREREQQLFEKAFGAQWVQFRLNNAGDDIDILQPATMMRQVGYETGEQFCPFEPNIRMNLWYVRPAPLNDDMSQWVRVPHFSMGIAAIRYAFNAARGVYEWVQTGPLLPTAPQSCYLEGTGRQLTETTVLRHRDSWVVLARSAERSSTTSPGPAWFRTDDLFKPLPEPIYPGAPLNKSPGGAFRCPDGAMRLFTNDGTISPYGNDRDPIYCWDIDPDNGFTPAPARVVFDAIKAGVAVRPESWTRADMPNLLPHPGGREQILTCRARARRRKFPYTRLINQEKQASGVYHCRVVYNQEMPATWTFAQAAASHLAGARS